MHVRAAARGAAGDDFIRAIADGKAPRPSFEDGVQNQRVLDAIERSAQSGRWEKIPRNVL